ncbi:MAG: galactokinase, partial [Chloroflexi bacterium]
RHVITENRRVLAMVEALEQGDLEAVGELMTASHASLRDDYEVSCPELEALVEIAQEQPGVVAARLTGAGWGGCTVNLVWEEAVPAFVPAVVSAYQERTGRVARVHICRAADGVTLYAASR